MRRVFIVGPLLTALVATALVPALATPALAVDPAPAAAGPTVVSSDGSSVIPVTPARLHDGRVTAGTETPVAVLGRGGVPLVGVDAVVLSVLVSGSAAGGHVTVFPTGELRPNASNINYIAGQTAARTVVVRLGRDGKVSLVSLAAARLVVDVSAWMPTGAGVNAVTPARILDRRVGAKTVDGRYAGQGRTAPAGTINLLVAGRGGVPVTAGAVLLNVTVTGAVAAGHITAWPTGARRPTASNLNYGPGKTVPNLVLARVGTGGQVSLYVHAPAFVIADVVGWVPDGNGVTTLVPARLYDGRSSGGPTRPGAPTRVVISGRGGIPTSGAKAAVLNVTALRSGAPGGLVAYASGTAKPASTQLAYAAGETVAGLVVAPVGADGAVQIATSAAAYLIVDVLGWVEQGRLTQTSLSIPQSTAFIGAGDVVNDKPVESGGNTVVSLAASTDPVQVGDHLAVAASTAAPDGTVGRVLSVTETAGGGRDVVLAPARLADAVPVGEVTYQGPLAGIAGSGATAGLRSALLRGLALNCSAELPLRGDADLGINVDLHFKWGNGVDEARLVFDTTLAFKASVNGALGGTCEITAPSHIGWSVPVGPVIMAFSAQPYAKFEGTASLFKTEASITLTSKTGFSTVNGVLSPISEGKITPSFTAPTFSQPSGTFKAGFGYKISARAYGSVGVEVAVGPEFTYTVTRSGAAYSCDVGLGMRVSGTAGIRYLFGALEAEIASGVLVHSDLGRIGCGAELPPDIRTGTLPGALTGSAYFHRLTAVSALAPVNWAATGLPPGLQVSGRDITGTPTAAGSFTVSLTATDNAGQVTTRSIPLAVAPATAETEALKGRIARLADGRSWYVDLRGARHAIPDGGVYECLRGQGKAVVESAFATVDKMQLLDPAQCVRATEGQLVTVDADSYLVDPGFVRRSVVDGPTYLCLRANGKSVYAPRVPRYWLMDLAAGSDINYPCWNSSTARGTVVRAEGGRSYYIDLRGGRHHIPDTGTLDCLRQQGKADYGNVVPVAWVDALPPYEDAVCVRANPTDIVKVGGAAYYINSDWSVRHIVDGITYQCLTANASKAYGFVPSYWLLDLPRAADYSWHCWNKDAARGKVVRFTDGSSWYVDLRGDRHHVPDGGTYECIKAQRGDYGSIVPADRLSEMTAYEPAQCVRANIGNIVKFGADAYIVADGWARQRITNGVTYDCLTANGRSVYGTEVPRYWLLDLGAGADYTWNCWNRDTARGKVVRTSDGSSWYVDLRGGRHHVPDGGTYECIKAQRGDYGHVVPRYSLNELAQYEDAACVRPVAGGIVRHTDGDAYMWTGSQLRWIPTGASYNCLRARGRSIIGAPRYWILDAGRGTDIGSGETCNLILTHSGGGDSHWITPEGHRRWIPTTTVYYCIANRGVPRFYTGDRGLIDNGWQQAAHATC